MQKELAHAQMLLSKKQPNSDKAIKLLRRLLKRYKSSWTIYHYLGVALLQKSEYSKALLNLQKALQHGSTQPETSHLISVAYLHLEQYDEAISYALQAIELKNDFSEAWINLGAAYRATADLERALNAFSQANQIDPKNSGIAYRIGSIYFDQGNLSKAKELYEITVKMEPEFIEAYLGQALIHLKLQKYEEAVSVIHEALKIKPNHKLALIQLAVAYKDWGKYAEAIKLNEQLLRKTPKDGRLRINYALCLLEVGRFNEAEEHYMRAFKDSPDAPESLSNYLMGIHYNPERTKEEIFDAHLLWDEYFAPEVRNERPLPNNIDRNKKLKIGFISGGFRKHPVGWMITRAIESLPKDQFELYGYNTHSMYDSLSMRIKKSCDKWTSVIGYNDHIVAKLIKEDEIDILVELSGHSAFNRLKTVALEPAPITIKWVGGLFNTTGLRSVDYLLTDHYESPEGDEPYYTEKLVRMPNDYVCYEPPEYYINVGSLPAKYNGFITFGCFNNPTKLNDQLIEQWAEILKSVPNSRLFLKSKQYSTQGFVDHILTMFSKHEIGNDRILFEGYALHEDLLASYNQIDIALDPWPYSGGLTTCEALWMGVPVVTCAGPTFAGRHSVTHLFNSGNSDWITKSWDEYKSKIVELATDIDKLEVIRGGLRQKLLESPLCNGAQYGAHLSIAFREMWNQRVTGYENNLKEGEWQDHITVKALSNEKLNEFCISHNVPKEPAFILDYQEFQFSEQIILALPKDLTNLTHYNLEEKGNPNKNLEPIFTSILEAGDKVIEVGAGYGTFTVALAEKVGVSGNVISFEPNSNISNYLRETKRINNLNQIQIIEQAASHEIDYSLLKIGSIEEHAVLDKDKGTLFINTTTIDSVVECNAIKTAKLVVLDTFGAWKEILAGAKDLINNVQPIMCIGNNNKLDHDSLKILKNNGYQFFEFIEEVGVLSKLEEGNISTVKWLFALTDEWTKKLESLGFIFTNNPYNLPLTLNYLDSVQYQFWAQSFNPNWIQKPEGEAEEKYFRALNILWEVDQNNKLTPSQKAVLSVEAASSLLDLYTANPQNIPVVCSLSRAFRNIGKQQDAASILKNGFQQMIAAQSDMDLSLPFLLPLKEQEKGRIRSNSINWLKVKLAEAWLLQQRESTFFLEAKEVKLLKQLNGNPDALPSIMTIADKLLSEGPISITSAPSLKPSGKFLHIVFNHVYAQTLNDLLEYTNKKSDQQHYLLLEKDTAIEGYYADCSNNANAEVFDKRHDLERIKSMCLESDVDAVFFHGIFLDWQRTLVKHIGIKKHVNWIVWGGDLYNPIKYGQPSRYINGFIDAIHTIADGDIKLFKDTYGEKQTYEFGYLYPGLYGENIKSTKKQDPPLIIVGNSGDKENRHLEVLDMLSKKSDITSYRILLPVAYNLNKEYENELVQGIKKLGLESSVKLHKEFIHPDQYIEIMSSASFFIAAHNRQQAIGNTLASIYGGNKTFMRKEIILQGKKRENPGWTLLQEYGLEVHDYELLKSVTSLSELPEVSEEQKLNHQHIIKNEFGIEKRSNQLINSSKQILETLRSKQLILTETM